jgi:hypothetical protein
VGIAVRELELTVDADRDLGALALEGGAPIQGLARHLDGTPARGLELWAIEGDMTLNPDGPAAIAALSRAREGAGGLLIARDWTDAEGRFAIGGLRPGHYALISPEEGAILEPRQGRWEPGQPGVELSVLHARLVVQVLDARGRPARGAIVEAIDIALDAEGRPSPGEARRAIARGSTALACLPADPEVPIALRARTRTRRSEERLVFLGQGSQHREETLTLADPAGTGAVRLVLLGERPAGEVRVRALLLAPVSGAPDVDTGPLEADAQGVLRGVPAGEHAFGLEFSGEAGAWLFPWRSSAPLRVAADDETLLQVELQLGARLALRAELAGPPPEGLPRGPASAIERSRFGARAVLLGDGDTTLPLSLLVGGERVGAILPGETAEVEGLVPAGDWTLRVEGSAWRVAESRVRTIAGRRLQGWAELRAY